MESENKTDSYEDNRNVNQSRQSILSTKKYSPESSSQKHKNNSGENHQDKEEKHDSVESRSKTRTWRSDPDRDEMSDREGQRSSRSFYSQDYENESRSDGSLSSYSRSRTPSPAHQRGVRAKRITGSHLYKTAGGVGRRGLSRPLRLGGQPLTQQHRRGVRSQSKESTPPKDLDLVTKRMLSARLLKINDLRNSLAELQQRTDELQKENRTLRQLQVRQEKALQRYDDTESEISQLLSRHSNETHVLRERLRRTQERERVVERRLKDSEEQLQRSQATIAKLKKLVNQRELGARDELSRKLEEEKTRAQEAERKIKELERSMELSNSSFQRQLAAERKKTISAQEDIGTLQEELERLTNKLKEKERELDTKNIYANRMVKPSLKKDMENDSKRKAPSRNSSKAVQAKDRLSSLDFPTPPPAFTDANECSEQAPDDYISVKELGSVDRQAETEDHQSGEQQKTRDIEKDRDKEKELVKKKKEKQQLNQELNGPEEKSERLTKGWENEKEEEDRKGNFLVNEKQDSIRKHGHVQEKVDRWNHEALASQQAEEEMRRKKELLLAKMNEIDRSIKGAQDEMFSNFESNRGTSEHSSPHPPEKRSSNSSIFQLTEPDERAGSREGGRRRSGIEGGVVTTGIGRRALRLQNSGDDLAFGSYAPSFGNSASRGSSGFPPPPPAEERDSALEAIGVFSLRGVETEKETEKGVGRDRKSSLMQQLFGALATPVGDSVSPPNKMEVLSSPPATNGVRSRREGLFSFSSGSPTPPTSSLNTIHVAESRPAIRAITSFNEDDLEELTL
ncbi:lebercilin isoform 2-T2 [Tautogolabrus adspersus]